MDTNCRSIHGFVCAVGHGGTLAGVSIGLKEKNKNIKISFQILWVHLIFSLLNLIN